MFTAPTDRQIRELELILKAAREGMPVTVEDLVDELGVSAATVYNDLNLLSRLQLARSRGGSRGAIGFELQKSDSVPERFALRSDLKEVVAEYIVGNLLPSGSVVYLDSGSTCYFVAQAILEEHRNDLAIVTSNPFVLHSFATSNVVRDVIALGGTLRSHGSSLYGPLTESGLDNVAFDIAVMGVDYVHSDAEGTLASFSDAEIVQKRIAIQKATKSVVVAIDESKLDRNLGNAIAGLRTIAKSKTATIVVGTSRSSTSFGNQEIVKRLRSSVIENGRVVPVSLGSPPIVGNG